MIKCSKCKKDIDEQMQYCPYCGEEQRHYKFCIKCGEKMELNNKYCPKCGADNSTSTCNYSTSVDKNNDENTSYILNKIKEIIR